MVTWQNACQGFVGGAGSDAVHRAQIFNVAGNRRRSGHHRLPRRRDGGEDPGTGPQGDGSTVNGKANCMDEAHAGMAWKANHDGSFIYAEYPPLGPKRNMLRPKERAITTIRPPTAPWMRASRAANERLIADAPENRCRAGQAQGVERRISGGAQGGPFHVDQPRRRCEGD